MKWSNPVCEGADPFLLRCGDTYYHYATLTPDQGFTVRSSRDLTHWEEHGFCLRRGDVAGNGGFWAPEVLERNGKFYMIYVADEHLGVAAADSPLGPFTQTEKRFLDDRCAIDGHFFVDEDGSVYLYFVRFDHGNVLWCAKMREDLLSFDPDSAVFLLRAEAEWETRLGSVLEGPFVLRRGARYYLTYSANDFRSPDYAVGYAVSDSPLGPFVRAAENPILRRSDFCSGTGHHSFVSAPDGTLLCVYHTHRSPAQVHPRMTCIDRAAFVDDRLVIYGPTQSAELD